MDELLVNLGLVILCFNLEAKQIEARGFQNDYLYDTMMFAYNLGTFVSLSSLQVFTLKHPSLPTVMQLVNCGVCTVLIATNEIQWASVLFLWSVWVALH